MACRFVVTLVCHLVISRSVLSQPSPAKKSENAGIAKMFPILFAIPRNQRIIGGEPVPIEKFPYVVSLQQNGTFFGHNFEHFCGGNIIGEKWILTAAKCCYGKEPSQFHVRVGSELYYMGGRIHEIESIVIHPSYDQFTWDYDVGLLKLREAVIFSEKIQPIRLPETDYSAEVGSVVDIAGWGTTTLYGMPSDRLHGNSELTISQKDCEAVYSKEALTDRMFCVFRMGHGPCLGDTGSPAIVDGVIIGVASWSQSCAYKYPTVYASLPEMADWIIQVTGNQSSSQANKKQNTAAVILRQQ